MRESTTPRCRPVLETLEIRRFLSGGVAAAFAGRLPSILPPTGSTRITLRLTNTAKTAFNGPVTIRLFASSDGSLDSSDLLLGTLQQNMRLKPNGRAVANVQFSAPTALPNGSYFLLAEVDGSSTIAISAKPIAFQNPFSDVSI